MTARLLIARYPRQIAAIRRALVEDFDTPAQRTINAGFAAMGIERFTHAGDDLWDMIDCHANGWEYQRPPAHLVRRWRAY